MTPIQFGTDGWRAIIADEFTFENVRIIAQAWSDHLIEHSSQSKGVAVSYDTRFMSDRFARAIAEVVASNKIPVFLSKSVMPTPVLSFTVKDKRLAGGIMVTASHNPYYYNGIKFKGAYGGPVLSEVTDQIAKKINQNKPRIDPALIRQYLVEEDFFDVYEQHLQSYLKFDVIGQGSFPLIYDPMHGAGAGLLNRLLRDTSCRLESIHDTLDPLFNGKHPEPIPENLTELIRLVKSKQGYMGIATDGDADRFGVIAEDGQFAQLHDLMPLLFRYLVESRGWSGQVVRTTSMADTIDRVAQKYGRTIIEVPVGFKHVTEIMLKEDILIGGEESGGFGFKNHLPERDGLLSSLLLLEMLAAYRCRLVDLIRQLREDFGPFAYGRIDRYDDYERLQKNLSDLRGASPKQLAGYNIERVSLIDGIKFYFENGAWMLIRVSQTEPLARIYVGADEKCLVDQLLQAGVELITKK